MIQINIQYIQKMMAETFQEILTVLTNDWWRGIAQLGCAMAGIYYETE
jgi:hypothetical protein